MNIPKNCVGRGRKHKMQHLNNGVCMCGECGISCGEIGHYEVRNNNAVFVVDSPKLGGSWLKAKSFVGNKVKLASLCVSFSKKSN